MILNNLVRRQLAAVVFLAAMVIGLLGGGLAARATVDAQPGIAIACAGGTTSGNSCGG